MLVISSCFRATFFHSAWRTCENAYLVRLRCVNSRQGCQQMKTGGIRDTRCRMSRRNRQRHQFQAPGQIPRRRVMHPDSTAIGKRVGRLEITLQRANLAISPCAGRTDREEIQGEQARHASGIQRARKVHALIARLSRDSDDCFSSRRQKTRRGADEGEESGQRESPWHFPTRLFATVHR